MIHHARHFIIDYLHILSLYMAGWIAVALIVSIVLAVVSLIMGVRVLIDRRRPLPVPPPSGHAWKPTPAEPVLPWPVRRVLARGLRDFVDLKTVTVEDCVNALLDKAGYRPPVHYAYRNAPEYGELIDPEAMELIVPDLAYPGKR